MESGVRKTRALVLETNNLQGGGADAERLAASLERLLRHLSPQLGSLEELVVTHEGLTSQHQGELEKAAGRSIRFVRLAAGTGYYDAKNQGFDATTAELVAFGDADCWPEEGWLERLFAPFELSTDVKVVAGRTTYRGDTLGIAATTIDFMYFQSKAEWTKNFYANNVAFRRQVFARYRYLPVEGVYRGHCQMLGMRLYKNGVPVIFEPRARTTHRFPDSARELFKLRMLRGADSAELTPHFAEGYLPKALAPTGRVPLAALGTLAIRFGYSVRALGHQDMPEVKGLKKAACIGAIGAITLADAAGAVQRTLVGRPRIAADKQSLSYHQDVDALDAA